MDFALRYNPTLKSHDIAVDAATADLVREDTLATAVVLSLLCDRQAQAHEVAEGADRRGWWADAFTALNVDAAGAESFGSRLWLLMREKQLPETQQRLRQYVEEALLWMVEDGLASGVTVLVFVPRVGWYVAEVTLQLATGSRKFRYEFNGELQVWRFAGELV